MTKPQDSMVLPNAQSQRAPLADRSHSHKWVPLLNLFAIREVRQFYRQLGDLQQAIKFNGIGIRTDGEEKVSLKI